MPNRQNRALPTIRVLQVEDSALDAELVLGELDADGIDYDVRLVDDEQPFLEALEQFQPDIVLSDLSMPGFSGQRALELLRERDEDTPFIFVSATLGEEAAIEALRNGATDYILKQNPARLASAVRRALSEAEAQRAARRAESELIRAQRFESLAMLAGGLSHDLRNLLQPLLLAGDSLQDYQDDPRLARLGTLVRDCGKRGLEMVQSMLSFARGARRAEQVRLGGLLEALGLLLQGSMPRSVNMDVALDDPEVSFEGNHTELQQCLLNLCLNAIQAMPDGGHLRIESAQVQLDGGFLPGRRGAAPRRLPAPDRGRHRRGHGRGDAAAAVRAVLHHQGSRHRPGSAVVQAHRGQSWRRDAGGQQAGRGHAVPSLHPAGRAARGCRARATATTCRARPSACWWWWRRPRSCRCWRTCSMPTATSRTPARAVPRRCSGSRRTACRTWW